MMTQTVINIDFSVLSLVLVSIERTKSHYDNQTLTQDRLLSSFQTKILC